MDEIESSEPWPTNSIHDVNRARIMLQNVGFIAEEPIMFGPPRLIKCLDTHLGDELTTYHQFLLKNNLVKKIVEWKHDEDCIVLLSHHIDFIDGFDIELRKARVKIKNVKCKHPPLPRELTDEELLDKIEQPYARIGVIREVAKRIFQTLKGSTNDG